MAVDIQDIGPIVAAGPLAAGLAGAVTGGVTGAVVGGVVGALEAAGLSHDEARYFEDRFRSGGMLLTVRTDGSAESDDARRIIERHGGDVRGSGVGTGAATMGTVPSTGRSSR